MDAAPNRKAAKRRAPRTQSPPGSKAGARSTRAAGSTGRATQFWIGIVVLGFVTFAALRQLPRDDPFASLTPAHLAWWTEPIEVNAFARLPTINSDLMSVCTVRGARRVWIAGSAGFVAHSDDDGRSWVKDTVDWSGLRSLPGSTSGDSAARPQLHRGAMKAWLDWIRPRAASADARPESASFNPAVQQGQIGQPNAKGADVGAKTVHRNPTAILRPSDSKVYPKTVVAKPPARPDTSANAAPDTVHGARVPPPAAGPPTITALLFHDARLGWGVGERGTVIRTNDGGAHWVVMASGVGDDLTALMFLGDGRRGWACGANDVIIATSDSGDTWTVQNSYPRRGRLESIDFAADGDHGWAVGSDPFLFTTTDGGSHWAPDQDPMGTGLRAAPGLVGVHFDPDGRDGSAITARAQVFVTHDGGSQWRLVSLQLGVFSRSQPWADLTRTLHDEATGRVWALSGRSGHGKVAVSRDSGITWSLQPDLGFTPRAMARGSDGKWTWIVGDRGAVHASLDGGEHWLARTQGAGARLGAIALSPDASSAVAVGGAGAVLVSSDAGRTWSTRPSGTKRNLDDVFVGASGRTVWAVGDSGTVVASTDGGMSWQSQRADSTASLSHVSFQRDERHGWTSSSRLDYFFSTSDAGATWVPTVTRRPTYLLGPLDLANDGITGWVFGAGYGADALTLATTVNAGASWQTVSVPAPVPATASFLPGARRGWIIGSRLRTVAAPSFTTIDGGATWDTLPPLRSSAIRSVRFLTDSLGWVIGADDTIFVTRDGGHTWTSRPIGDNGQVESAQFADASRGWAVGPNGLLAFTTNGGADWKRPEPHRYPAPWYYLMAFVLLVGFIRPALSARPEEPAEKSSVADLLASDRPIRSREDDRLDSGRIAAGIARFLANENTDPPLTLAITGDWGSGKSSVMYLIRGMLAEYGFRSVWFNAWHYQSEEQLLPSLMESIRRQGLPEWWSPRGLGFRCRLLYIRGVRHWLPAAATLFACAALATFVFGSRGNRLDTALDAIRRLAHFETPTTAAEKGSFAALAVSILTPAFILLRGMTTVGFGPNRLATLLFGGLRITDTTTPTGFRQGFAQTFEDITRAMGQRRLVILIDDLDRCQPEHAVEVLEMVNFLVSSGDCFVIMGMAPPWVQRSIGLGFERVAQEMVDLDPAKAESGSDPAREKRHEFARRYLEKLVNIEAPLPDPTSTEARSLLVEDPALVEKEHGLGRWIRARVGESVRAYAPLVAAGLVLWAGIARGPALLDFMIGCFAGGNPPVQTAATQAPAPISASTTSAVAGLTGSPPLIAPVPSPPPSSGRELDGSLVPRASRALPPWLFTVALAALVIAGIVRLSMPPRRPERDSDLFRDALDYWYPLVFVANPTPRSMKRFLNRVRYFAMCQRPAEREASGAFERLGLEWLREALEHLRLRKHRESPPVADSAGLAIPEDVLVALAAIDHARAAWLNDAALWLNFGEYMRSKVAELPQPMQDRVLELSRYGSFGDYREHFTDMTRGIVVRA
ncbi:MAG TPA: YCF48-related protein [Candidatus Eisenbacteria bacterium]